MKVRLINFTVGMCRLNCAPQCTAFSQKSAKAKLANALITAAIALTSASCSSKPAQVTADKVNATTNPANEEAQAAPAITVDKAVHDFGTTWSAEELQHTFKITNTGNANLKITSVKPQCGCTPVAKDYPKELEPGQAGEYKFSVISNSLRGEYAKTITIFSNDPINPQLKLELRGICKHYVDINPPQANFGVILDDKPRAQTLKITNNTEKPLELALNPLPPNSKFKIELTETEPGLKYELHVATLPPYQKGSYNTNAVLSTNIEAEKKIDIRLFARVPNRLDVQPVVLMIYKQTNNPQAANKTRPPRTLWFRNYGPTPVRVLEATVDDPAVELVVNEREAGQLYAVSVKMPYEYEPPPEGRTISLKTDDPQQPVIQVPLRGMTYTRSVKPTKQDQPSLRPAELMVGRQAPSFKMATKQGKSASNADLSETIMVLNFVAMNCPHCMRQLPRFEKIQTEYKGKKVRFINVSQTMGSKSFTDDQVVAKMNQLGIKSELVADPGNTIGQLFKATSFPTMVLLGKSGKIEAVNVGNKVDLETRVKLQLSALLAGRPVPKIAESNKTISTQPQQKPAMDLVGKPAPKFALKTAEGKLITSDDLTANRATVLDFVAPNCGYCKRQVPTVEAVRAEYEKKGVRFVIVNQQMGKKPLGDEEAAKVWKSLGSQMEFASDPANNVGRQLFKVISYPTLFVVGKDGVVKHVNIGAQKDLDVILKGQLEALLSG